MSGFFEYPSSSGSPVEVPQTSSSNLIQNSSNQALSNALAVGASLQGLGSSIYNIYQDQRDYNTQRDQLNRAYDESERVRLIQMAREDTSMQRRVADLEAAGIHKTLAVGAPGTQSGPYGAGLPGQGRAGGEMQTAHTSVLENAIMAKQLRAMDLSNERTLADIERTRADTEQIQRTTGNQWSHESRLAYRFGAEMDLLESQVRQNQISENEALNRIVLQAQTYRTRELEQHTEILRQAAAQLGITEQQLRNQILTHDQAIIERSRFRSDDRSDQVNTENYLRTLIPGDSGAAETARSILQPIISAEDYVINTASRVLRAVVR